MSLNNANNTSVVMIPLQSITADAEIPAIYAKKDLVIESAAIINGAEIAASDTNYVILKLKNGANEIASLDTRAAAQNGLADKVGKEMVLDADHVSVAAGSSLSVNYDEEGTVSMTNAVMSLTVRTK